MGRMPNESIDDDASIEELIEEYDKLLESIRKPISKEEGTIIVKLFPENAFYDLHWTLLQLVESLFENIEVDEYKNLIKQCPSKEWREAMEIRLKNANDKH